VVGLTKKTDIKNLKNILELLDDAPLLDKNMLSLTKEISDYYCCSWGEVIAAALPETLRKIKGLPKLNVPQKPALGLQRPLPWKLNEQVELIHDLDGRARWEIYLKAIKETLDIRKSVIVLVSDIGYALKVKDSIGATLDIPVATLYRKYPQELEEWIKVKGGMVGVAVGTRSGIFAPFDNLGLVIIDEEHSPIYKQDQVPHYHAREVSFMRVAMEKARLILGSSRPSLETFYLAQKSKIKYTFIPRSMHFPEIKTIDAKFILAKSQARKTEISKYLEDALGATLNAKGKALLFLNRKGFATVAFCYSCGTVLKCPRCNINLAYHFKEGLLNCHYCNFKILPPKICLSCNSGYIKYTGAGIEKIESELSRIFPQARIKGVEKDGYLNIDDGDIFITTKPIIGPMNYNFDLVGILSLDNSLNRVDFRAAEKTFGLLVNFLSLTSRRLIVQTRLSHHHCLGALINKDINIFYKEEMKQRKQLRFPPYGHIGLVKLRGKIEERVKASSGDLFNGLQNYNKDRKIKIVSVNPGQPSKLRGNFYWQVLIKSDTALRISKFLKNYLKDFSHSGIIVTVDIDPV
jgi:primosomal protein N' (replication factor Y)